MNRLMGLAFAAALCLPASAMAAEPTTVALLNTDRIFKEFAPFREEQEKLQETARDVEQRVQVRQAELETVNNQLRKTPPGTPEFTRLQIQVVKLQNELQQFVNTERQNLQKLEAATLLRLHRQLDEQVRKYAKSGGIRLVLRYHDVSFDEDQSHAELVKTVNRQILYEDRLDITDAILKELQKSAAAP